MHPLATGFLASQGFTRVGGTGGEQLTERGIGVSQQRPLASPSLGLHDYREQNW